MDKQLGSACSPERRAEEQKPFVSVIIPCRNEARSIARCLDSIIANTYPKDRLEVLVVDGTSEDGSREILEDYGRRFPCLRVLTNPRRTTPAALNIGILSARGEVVMRMDAHTFFPFDYICTLITALEETGADNVGGIALTQPAENTLFGQAIAFGLAHPFGVGNSYFRIGVGEPRLVDTVPFGCYRKEVFARFGLFDERLERNQDIEFNSRLLAGGGKILLVPTVHSLYQCPATLGGLAKQNFRNGFWNVSTRAVQPRALSLRHFVPLGLVSALLLSATIAAVNWVGRWVFLIVAGTYVIGVLAASLATARRKGWQYFLLQPPVFMTLHVSYGLGSLWGLVAPKR